jgi:hypothetical protein
MKRESIHKTIFVQINEITQYCARHPYPSLICMLGASSTQHHADNTFKSSPDSIVNQGMNDKARGVWIASNMTSIISARHIRP